MTSHNTNTTLRAFHGDPAVQAKYINRIEAHRAADEIVQGYFWENGTGCAVGCTLHDRSGNHAAYETELGIPAQLAHLEDAIFENLPAAKAKDWPLSFMTSIPLGADLSRVWPRFASWLMVDEEWGMVNVTDDEEVKELCREVARRYTAGETAGPEAEALTERLGAAWAARAARDARDAWAARDAFVEASAACLLMLLLTSEDTYIDEGTSQPAEAVTV